MGNRCRRPSSLNKADRARGRLSPATGLHLLDENGPCGLRLIGWNSLLRRTSGRPSSKASHAIVGRSPGTFRAPGRVNRALSENFVCGPR
jgi:hypothetical protein